MNKVVRKMYLSVVLLVTIGFNSNPCLALSADDANWREEFLDMLKSLDLNVAPVKSMQLSDFSDAIADKTPEELMHLVEQRIVLTPYDGALRNPIDALMGGQANTLDRARVLSGMLSLNSYENRIVFAPLDVDRSIAVYPETTPAPLQPVSPEIYQSVNQEVQSLSKGLWQKLCEDQEPCDLWVTNSTTPENFIYWLQYRKGENWVSLIPSDTHLKADVSEQPEELSAKRLEELAWIIRIDIINIYGGQDKKEKSVLSVVREAQNLHTVPISYDNIPVTDQSGFQPTLSLAEETLMKGENFALTLQGQTIDRQLLKITVKGPNFTHRHVRTLAIPTQAKGLEMVTRGRLTITTGPVWGGRYTELIDSAMYRLANLLYADDSNKNPSPLNLPSFTALSFLKDSYYFAGQVGEYSSKALLHQSRPAIIVERDFSQVVDGELGVFTDFDVVDPGHAIFCKSCSVDERKRIALEQGIVDGFIENWLAGDGQNTSSHVSAVSLLINGHSLVTTDPKSGAWLDRYAEDGPVYRLLSTEGESLGWRLDPIPQVVPIWKQGQGGARQGFLAPSAPVGKDIAERGGKTAAKGVLNSGTKGGSSPASEKGFLKRWWEHAQTKCGATDIGGNIILAMAGAPMTGPLLSTIVGHQCRVAEAYLKAADVLNCLEFMGNNCSAEKKAGELERMIKGLGPELAKDYAFNQAADIIFGGLIELATPVIKQMASDTVGSVWRDFWNRPRPRTPPDTPPYRPSGGDGSVARTADAGVDSVGRTAGEGGASPVAAKSSEKSTIKNADEVVDSGKRTADQKTTHPDENVLSPSKSKDVEQPVTAKSAEKDPKTAQESVAKSGEESVDGAVKTSGEKTASSEGGAVPTKRPEGQDQPLTVHEVTSLDELGDSGVTSTGKSQAEPASPRTIHDAVEDLYPGGKGAPKINTVGRNIHNKILNGSNWQQPARGGASFTKENIGTGRQGDIAIRVKPESEKHITWKEHSGGLVPIYTPPTGKWAGQNKTYIERQHLQYLDPSVPGKPVWRDYVPDESAAKGSASSIDTSIPPRTSTPMGDSASTVAAGGKGMPAGGKKGAVDSGGEITNLGAAPGGKGSGGDGPSAPTLARSEKGNEPQILLNEKETAMLEGKKYEGEEGVEPFDELIDPKAAKQMRNEVEPLDELIGPNSQGVKDPDANLAKFEDGEPMVIFESKGQLDGNVTKVNQEVLEKPGDATKSTKQSVDNSSRRADELLEEDVEALTDDQVERMLVRDTDEGLRGADSGSRSTRETIEEDVEALTDEQVERMLVRDTDEGLRGADSGSRSTRETIEEDAEALTDEQVESMLVRDTDEGLRSADSGSHSTRETIEEDAEALTDEQVESMLVRDDYEGPTGTGKGSRPASEALKEDVDALAQKQFDSMLARDADSGLKEAAESLPYTPKTLPKNDYMQNDRPLPLAERAHLPEGYEEYLVKGKIPFSKGPRADAWSGVIDMGPSTLPEGKTFTPKIWDGPYDQTSSIPKSIPHDKMSYGPSNVRNFKRYKPFYVSRDTDGTIKATGSIGVKDNEGNSLSALDPKTEKAVLDLVEEID